MKKRTFKQVAALTLAVAVMTPAASALSWKDGALADYHFTYAGDNCGIASVAVSDSNGTYSGKIKAGETITTQTGTIVWRDSYTNVTTFTVITEPGYELVGLSGTNVVEDDFQYDGDNTYTFSFTDKGAEAWCYGKDVSFDLVTDKTMYTITFEDEAKNELGFITAALGEPLSTSIVPEKEGYTFSYWMLDKTTPMPKTFTSDMLNYADDNKNITVTPAFTVNEYNVRVNYYKDNTQGDPEKALDTQVTYGEKLDKNYLNGYEVVGGTLPAITGDTTIALVKYTPVKEDFWSYEYGFLYNSKDEGVESVEYSINGSDWTAIDVNEGVKFKTGADLDQHTITFRVQVADGMELVLDSNGGNAVTQAEDGSYTFAFTRIAHQGLPGTSNIPNVTFNLTTADK